MTTTQFYALDQQIQIVYNSSNHRDLTISKFTNNDQSGIELD